MNAKTTKKSPPFLFLLSLILFIHSIAIAQHSKLDSLKQVILQQVEDTSKVDNLIELSFRYYQIDVNLCRTYAMEALHISEKLKDTTRIVQAYNCLGIASHIEGDAEQSIQYMKRCLSLSESRNNDKGKIKALNNLGVFYIEKGDIETSLLYFQRVLKLEQDNGLTKSSIGTLSNIGQLHLDIGNRERAFQYIQRALNTAEKVGIPSYLTKPNELMGMYYAKEKEYKAALPYLTKAYQLGKESTQNLKVAAILRLLGECEYHLGLKEKSILSFQEGEKLLIAIGEQQTDLHGLYQTWATILGDYGDYQQALKKANKSLALATKNRLETSKLFSLQLLGQLYEKTGDYQQALNYHKAAAAQEDSLQFQTKEALILGLEAKYQSDKKEIENQLLRTQQEKTKAELKIQNTLVSTIALVLGLVGMIAFLLLRAYRIKKRYNDELQVQVAERTKELETSNTQLKQSNIELERFTYIASHDLKTPLGNIINFTNILGLRLKNMEDTQIQQCLLFIKQGGERMKDLIEDVLEYSQLSDINTNSTNEEIDLNKLSKDLTNTLSSYLAERQAKIEIAQPLPILISNYSSIFMLFKNLVENALKYNESATPKVTIFHTSDAATFSLFFEDNGIGIPEEYFEKIWKMFGRLHTHSEYEGSGLGLATCKKIMTTLGGTIHVASIVGKGSTFELKFPKSCLAKVKPRPVLVSKS